jgi:integrase
MSQFDEQIIEFIAAQKRESTKQTYSAAFELFRKFYLPRGTIRDFLVAVESDYKQSSFLDQKRVAINVMNAFVDYMKKETDLKAKSMRTYAGAVQSLVKYFLPKDVKISTRYADLPSPNTFRKKYPWTLPEVSKFAAMMDQAIYRALVAVFFQSGISISDVLAFTYGDVEKEYKAGTVPLCLDLIRIKTDTPYMTFIGRAGVTLLRDYLHTRQSLEKTDKLFPISTSAVERYFNRRAYKLPRFDESLHYGPASLRTAFRSRVRRAGCPEEFVEFWMGHNLFDQQKIYTSMDRDGWRTEYAKIEAAVAFQIPQRRC